MRDWDRRRRSERRDSEGEGVRRIPCVVVSSEQNPEISGAPAAWRWGRISERSVLVRAKVSA